MSDPKKPTQPLQPAAADESLTMRETPSDALAGMNQAAGDANEVPGASGEFGYTPTNPIATNSPIDCMRYLNRLRQPNGDKVLYRLSRTMLSGFSGHMIDRFEITNLQGARLATLYLLQYYDCTSRKAPRGFLLEADLG